ncbi:MAG: hypothetical protein WC796_03600 [Candidatus Pacearchaeota archaeon]|jgi:hypothetical protein
MEINTNDPSELLQLVNQPESRIMNILMNPNLFYEIIDEFDKKIVEEISARKVIFLCSQGRLVKNHQIASYNLLVNDEAGVGKDYVCNAILEILPNETYIHKTRISPTVFTYWHNKASEPLWTWNGKVFYPEDISETVLNSDVFKVMCSNGSSAIITIKNRAVDIEIDGKPVIITTTANSTPNSELTRRFAILNLNSSENQTKLIMKRHSQYKKLGVVPDYNIDFKEAMSYLERVSVRIPFADILDKFFPYKSIIMRTHYPRFLDFISASAALYQFQRQKDVNGFVLAVGQDYDIARECFLALCSNKYMIPLTINQKKILEVFEKNNVLKGGVMQLHKEMNFISDKALQINLQKLVQYGFLKVDIERDVCNRDIEVYSLSESYSPQQELVLPTFEELCESGSEPSIPSEPSISSIHSIPHEVGKIQKVENMESPILKLEIVKFPLSNLKNKLNLQEINKVEL